MIEGNLALPFTTTVPGVEIAAYRASQRAPADFLRVDADLLDAAAGASPALPEVRDDPHALAAHIAGIPTSEKDRLLGLLAADQATRARMELLRSFRGVSMTALPVRQRRVRLLPTPVGAMRRSGRSVCRGGRST